MRYKPTSILAKRLIEAQARLKAHMDEYGYDGYYNAGYSCLGEEYDNVLFEIEKQPKKDRRTILAEAEYAKDLAEA